MSINVALLQSSFLRVIPQQQTFSANFYNILFAEHPEVTQLFANTDIRMQQSKLFAGLAATISNLNNPTVLIGSLQELGRRHVGYNVKPEHYTLVKEALLKTFEIVLCNEWTEELRVAWSEGFDAIATLMQDATAVSAQ